MWMPGLCSRASSLHTEAWNPIPFASPASPWQACSDSHLVCRLTESQASFGSCVELPRHSKDATAA